MKKLIAISIILLSVFYSYSQKIPFLNESTFKEKIWNYEKNSEWKFKGEKPVIILFYADWVTVNKELEANLVSVQKNYGNKLKVYKINFDKSSLVSLLKVRIYPTLLFIPVKGEYKRVRNYRSKEQLDELVSNILKVEK